MTEPDISIEGDDPLLWIVVPACGQRDYLHGNGHTYRGRMSAYCPHEKRSFSVSKYEISEMSPEAARWIDGFLRGNEPTFPFAENGMECDDDDPQYVAWREGIARFHETGRWPVPEPPADVAQDVVAGAADDRSRYIRFTSPEQDIEVLLVVRRWDDDHLALTLMEDIPAEGVSRAGTLLDDAAARALVAALTDLMS